MIVEYQTLEFLYDRLSNVSEDFGAIRPLLFMQKYFALLMEEYPSRTMTQLMEDQRSNKVDWESSELKDAARKTGRWLYYFHHHINTAIEKPYTGRDILEELRPYAEKIEASSQGRVRAQSILEAFSGKLQTCRLTW